MVNIISDLVSIITPVYNRPGMIRRAVESVLAQAYRPIEIILVDDGSTDDTPAVLDRIASEHPDVIKVIHKENGGPGLAREAGRLEARGEFIQYLDSDDWLLPRKFEIQVKALRDNPAIGIAYGITRLVDANGNILKEPSKCTGRKFEYLFPMLLVDRWWHTSTPLYRRTVSDAAGAWPKQRPEDWDLEARMGALKTKLVYCDEAVSCHRHHPGDNRVSGSDRDAYLRDEAWFLPRLYQCALRAGVKVNTPEMQHFSRWAFMRARHLGAMGETDMAWTLYGLAVKSAARKDLSMRLVEAFAKMAGWKVAGRISSVYDKIRPVSDIL